MPFCNWKTEQVGHNNFEIDNFEVQSVSAIPVSVNTNFIAPDRVEQDACEFLTELFGLLQLDFDQTWSSVEEEFKTSIRRDTLFSDPKCQTSSVEICYGTFVCTCAF